MHIPTDLAGVAKFIYSKQCNNILFLTGAGISVASGIPDFRSPGGMYDTLQPQRLTATPEQRMLMEYDPTYVVEKEMFLSNSFPYLEVRRPFILGTYEQKWKKTLSHVFAELLSCKTNKLRRVYTQNIDGLYRQCQGLSLDKLVEVHGTMGDIRCEICGTPMDYTEFYHTVKKSIKDIYNIDEDAPKESKHINCSHCGKATVKPSTVLFGSGYPQRFFDCIDDDLQNVDLLIIAGTSLQVYPISSIVARVPDHAMRMVANIEPVGQELGIMYENDNKKIKRDFFAQGPCDNIFLELMDHLDWMDDVVSHINDISESSAKLVRDWQQQKLSLP